jgi:hypothetical protein
MSVVEKLKEGLKEAFEDCQGIQGKGCTASTNDKVAGYIAKPIAEAIDEKDIPTIANWQGIATVEQINEMISQQKNDGWNIAGSGTIVNPDGSQIEVTDGDGVMWNGSKWNLVIDINIQSISDDFINNLN